MTGRWLEVIGVVLVVWVVRAYFWPYAKCRRCKGSGVNRGSTAQRFGLCPRCGGSRRRQVFGSKAVHRAVRSGRSAWSSRRGS